KTFLEAQGVATVAFGQAQTRAEAEAAAVALGCPLLMKTRREGYDGKGQRWVEHVADAGAAFEALGARPVILEALARFTRELSVIAVRGRSGEIAVYPPGENHPEGGFLRRSTAPAGIAPRTLIRAEAIAGSILRCLDYVGVIGVELC